MTMTTTTERATHTPGPWTARGSSVIATPPAMGSETTIAICGGWNNTRADWQAIHAEQDANARLMAAAPDLLNVAGLIAEWLAAKEDRTEAEQTALDWLLPAIARAEGR